LLQDIPGKLSSEETNDDVLERMVTQNIVYLLGREATPFSSSQAQIEDVKPLSSEKLSTLPTTEEGERENENHEQLPAQLQAPQQEQCKHSTQDSDTPAAEEDTSVALLKRPLHAGSPFLPPPSYFVPAVPEPAR
jgi:hypothetical protein